MTTSMPTPRKYGRRAPRTPNHVPSASVYGFLTVFSMHTHHRASGKSYVKAFCRCTLCSKTKTLPLWKLRNGSKLSCGCVRNFTAKRLLQEQKACEL